MSTRMSVLSSTLLALAALTAVGLIGVGVGFADDEKFGDETGGKPKEKPWYQVEFRDLATGGTCEFQAHAGLAPWNVHLYEYACPAGEQSCDYYWTLAFPSGKSVEEKTRCTPETADQKDCIRAHQQFPDRCPAPGGGDTNPSGGTNPPGGSSGDRPGTNPSGGNGGGTNPPTGPAPGGGNVSFGASGASTWTPAVRPAPPVRPLWLGRSNTGWSQPQPTRGNASRRWW